jgi:hypothetical protein
MRTFIFRTIVIFLGITIPICLLVYYDEIPIKYIYWLPYIWLVIIIICFRLWEISKSKIFLISHILVLMAGLFSFLTYQIFKQLDPRVSLSEDKFDDVSSLMFNSENALYLMLYGGFILLIADLVYFYRKSLGK